MAQVNWSINLYLDHTLRITYVNFKLFTSKSDVLEISLLYLFLSFRRLISGLANYKNK